MTTLSYSVTQPALRSPVEEWQPHDKQSESTTEWWYLTALVHDTPEIPTFWFGVPSTSQERRPVRRPRPAARPEGDRRTRRIHRLPQ